MNQSPEEATVPCSRCGEPTPMLDDRMCNDCWESRYDDYDDDYYDTEANEKVTS